MKAHTYTHGSHKVYGLHTDDLEAFVAMHGWTVTNDLENVGPRDQAELDRLRNLPYLDIPDRPAAGETWTGWNKARLVSATPCLTPDQ